MFSLILFLCALLVWYHKTKNKNSKSRNTENTEFCISHTCIYSLLVHYKTTLQHIYSNSRLYHLVFLERTKRKTLFLYSIIFGYFFFLLDGFFCLQLAKFAVIATGEYNSNLCKKLRKSCIMYLIKGCSCVKRTKEMKTLFTISERTYFALQLR